MIRIYRDYSDYDVVRSLERAGIFIQVARMLLATPVRRTASGGRGGEEVELEPRIVSEQLQRAEGWYHANYASSQPPRQVIPAEDFRC